MQSIDSILNETIELYNERKLNCAETVLISMCRYMGVDDALMPRIATTFGGGMGGTQSVCGAVTGGLMAIGIIMGREQGGDQLPARQAAARFISEFNAAHGAKDCATLTGIDMSDPAQMEAFRAPGGGHHKVCNECVRWACRYVARLYDERK